MELKTKHTGNTRRQSTTTMKKANVVPKHALIKRHTQEQAGFSP